MSAAATLHPAAARRPARARSGTWRGWVRWGWTQLVAIGAARYRARMARGHGRY